MKQAVGSVVAAILLFLGIIVAPATPSSAGIGYWSNGCNPHAEWFEYQGEHLFRLFTRNEYNKAATERVIIHALRRTYAYNGNECGPLAELKTNEYYGAFPNPFTGYTYREGWKQEMVGGFIVWDKYDCRLSFVVTGGVARNGWCGAA